jgi:hypothetical protein
MAVKTDQKVRTAIARVCEGISEKAGTLGRDNARRVGATAWGVLTGERPPPKR